MVWPNQGQQLGTSYYGLVGQREESAIGLYYYNARWYDPYVGRFIQPDTIVPEPGNPQAYNRYTYVLNNPVRYTDPSGHWIPVEDEIPAQYSSPGYPPFGVRYTPRGQLRIVHGGSYFVNPYEKSIANYILSGGTRAALPLAGGAYSPLVGLAFSQAAHELGYNTSGGLIGNLGLEQPGVLWAAFYLTQPRREPLRPYEVGTYRELKARSVTGDELDVHHVPSKRVAEQVIRGYSYLGYYSNLRG